MSGAGAEPTGGFLDVRGLSRRFGRPGTEPVDVLRALDLRAEAGESLAIMGASGSGKSTLLHVLGGMLAPNAGVVELAGVRPWDLPPTARAEWRNSNIGFVFQSHRLLGELTALENVLVPSRIAGSPAVPAVEEARRLLADLGLAGRLHHFPSELSGGEAQRVAIARALARRPRLVLADEPTGNLDREAGRVVFEELLALQRTWSVTAVVATHDESLAARCDRVLLLSGGRLTDSRAAGPGGGIGLMRE